ncbi:NAD-dependent histone deacetylase SIR2 [Polyplosphaeria fusca]|uniref:NAD-dependent histone deacetylase SIR2 n=1 Tax=Polyplosphaeria fusca TaxID=682080 RepID=A0A9P4QY04_9PLEO|nr:NAD-dependent histone deacetylase SIR2 [Polyplosphaeria fusca]
MASSGYSGPVMVQEPSAPPAIDLTDSVAAEAVPTADPYDPPKLSYASRPAKREESPAEEDGSWETASLYEEILDDEFECPAETTNPHVCSAEEAARYRKRLHEVHASQFILETITAGKISARKLCTAFGVKMPAFLEGLEDEAYYQLLGLAINRELNKRHRLAQYKTIDDAVKLLQERKNILVITGAGISTSLGIPDFRSKNTGFYSRLLDMGYQEPEQVFDIHQFDENPTDFYKLAGDILPDLKKWTPTHQFIRLLQDKGKLLTNYTQNIDNVESHAGILAQNLIQCHGSWATASCRKCKFKVPGEEIFDAVREQKPAQCKRCIEEIATKRPGTKRKRSSNGTKKRRGPGDDDSDSDGAYDIPQPGVMKPDITFFGEALPNDFFMRLKTEDHDKVDLVIVMGTSMKVAPVSEIPNYLPREIPQIYISRDPIHHINFDINLLGDCDAVVAELARRAGWDLSHKMLAEDQQADVESVDEELHTYSVKIRRLALKEESQDQKA